MKTGSVAARHVEAHLGGMSGGEVVEDLRDLPRDAGTHQHHVHSGEHGPIQRHQRGRLDFFQQIEPHPSRVSLLGEMDRDETRCHHQLARRAGRFVGNHRRRFERRVSRLATGNEVAFEDARRRFPDREMPPSARRRWPPISPSWSCRVSSRSKRGAGNHPELPALRNRPCQAPAGNANSHASLNDRRQDRRVGRAWK